MLGVIAGSLLLYLWALDASGYGNQYYAAASYSGSLDWSAWFYGSIDTADFITVDKPPVSLWVTALSIRLFGLSSWSVLVPHALAGVASVGILGATVRRWHSPQAGVVAAVGMALTPVSVVIFRYNNPDAVLTLLLVAAIAVGYDAIRRGSGVRLALVGVLVGFGFLTKTTQALLLVPAIAVVYLVAAPVELRRRIIHVLAVNDPTGRFSVALVNRKLDIGMGDGGTLRDIQILKAKTYDLSVAGFSFHYLQIVIVGLCFL